MSKKFPRNFGSQDPLDVVLDRVRKEYPVKKYILREDIESELYPQAQIIYGELGSGEKFNNSLYSYITFYQIYFHLKNHLLINKKIQNGYKDEFLDVFCEYFLDNYLIFREISIILEKVSIENKEFFFHVWFDGYFFSFYEKLLKGHSAGNKRLQPYLFFTILLYHALPHISDEYKGVVFSHLIDFTGSTASDFEAALLILDKLNFKKPLKRKNWFVIARFMLVAFDLIIGVDKNDKPVFDDFGIYKCVEFIKILSSKNNLMIDLIKNIAKSLNYKS